MIGQLNVKKDIDRLIDYKFPLFTVITGLKGSGKKTLANYIANKLNCLIIPFDIKIDSIREMIDLAYKQTEPIIYLIPDADKMSIGAKNSLLKIIEEPPNNAMFIMTLQSLDNTLPTIKSRCHEIRMELYTVEELEHFINSIKPDATENEKKILSSCCNNYGEIELFVTYGIEEFYNYAKKVYENIYKVQSANSFKICDKLELKTSEENKYDVELFLRTFRYIAYYNMLALLFEPNLNNQVALVNSIIAITSKYINKLTITGINKQSLIDTWILDIRKAWKQSNAGD